MSGLVAAALRHVVEGSDLVADQMADCMLEMMSGEVNGKFFITGPREIARYWSYVHGISRPH